MTENLQFLVFQRIPHKHTSDQWNDLVVRQAIVQQLHNSLDQEAKNVENETVKV